MVDRIGNPSWAGFPYWQQEASAHHRRLEVRPEPGLRLAAGSWLSLNTASAPTHQAETQNLSQGGQHVSTKFAL
jgi:hypothetical protein